MGRGLVNGRVWGMTMIGDIRKHGLGAPLDQYGHSEVPIVIFKVRVNFYSWDVGEGLVELSAADDVPIRSVGGEMTANEKVTPAVLGIVIVAKSTLSGTGSGGLGWVVVPCWEIASRPGRWRRRSRRRSWGGRGRSTQGRGNGGVGSIGRRYWRNASIVGLGCIGTAGRRCATAS